MQILAIRLNPDDDLKLSLQRFVEDNKIEAGFIITAVGSLKQASLRFADHDDSQVLTERFEIVSLVGTLSTNGIHLHISLSDQNGKTMGGHILDGCIIYTTAEIVIGVSDNLIFLRTLDVKTGYKELQIQPKL